MQCYDALRCPYGVGDRLWVREICLHDFSGFHSYWADYLPEQKHTVDGVVVDVELGLSQGAYWKCPSIHMPKRLTRIWVEVVSVRAGRLQGISPDDIYAEGYPREMIARVDPLLWFRDLWDKLNLKQGYGWETNPWAWVVSFKVVS